MSTIELRPLQYTHCEAVAEIAKESLPEHWSVESIRDVLRYENNIYYVACSPENNRIIGFAGIMIIADEAELLNIAVHPVFRTQRIGELLLERMLQEAVRSGAYRVLLEVRESNVSAQNLYMKYQFTQIAKRKNYYSNPVEDAIIMEKLLSAVK